MSLGGVTAAFQDAGPVKGIGPEPPAPPLPPEPPVPPLLDEVEACEEEEELEAPVGLALLLEQPKARRPPEARRRRGYVALTA